MSETLESEKVNLEDKQQFFDSVYHKRNQFREKNSYYHKLHGKYLKFRSNSNIRCNYRHEY